ncbi:uncharacterized protein MKZ38_009517 [Zalerion maritima]|uniref:Uncharacterized protein n=1 Tax=Zalerion maritima TaxID=339359 RepID=A0AAD5RTD2_9PEZI|nr:uncharacterized protein MKZ38_009517 [Zalerion maritima]
MSPSPAQTEPNPEASSPSGDLPPADPSTAGPATATNQGSESDIVRDFTQNIRDQGDLERDIIAHAETAIAEEEDKRDQQRIRRAEDAKQKLEAKKTKVHQNLSNAIQRGNRTLARQLEAELDSISDRMHVHDEEVAAFRERIDRRHLEPKAMPHGGVKLAGESTRGYLIRTGKITPFAKVPGELPAGVEGELAQAIVDAEGDAVAEGLEGAQGDEPKSHQNLQKPGFEFGPLEPVSSTPETEFSLRPRKKRKLIRKPPPSDDEFEPGGDTYAPSSAVPSPSASVSDLEGTPRKRKGKKAKTSVEEKVDLTHIDDGNEAIYQARLSDWVERRSRARRQHTNRPSGARADSEPEWFKPHPQHPDYVLGNGLKIPGDIHKVLFNYQKTGIHWLCELYEQQVGGILGDEMGLGKTVQAVSFVAALHYSKKLDHPALVVVPATLMRQWVNEFHQWWPSLRVSILHSSGSGMVNLEDESRIEDEDTSYGERARAKLNKAAKKVIDRVVEHGHVLVTTYAGLQTYAAPLNEVEWSYAILDEGHKIRNPNTAVTITCKQLKTPHRIILSGTPMQNNLTELWSIFDFVFPFRLGTLWNFRDQFEIPIRQGGYANSSNLQIMAAQKCAEVLKDIVGPYLLQRVKADVAQDLPKKTEQVLFCKFTETQRGIYEMWLRSEQRDLIIQQKMKALVGIDTLRKICNHPDLTRSNKNVSYGSTYGDLELSGKMQVVRGLLAMWKRLGHKCLIFSQGVQMLDILQKFVEDLEGVKFLRMDGSTPVKDRQKLVDKFNINDDIDVFLLTTRVGGLGLNLTGASRVILYDPDWNPSTDAQAQERAWRLGQKKDVQIFRLLTAGTIEEKIYQRQIFKTVLTNKVLKDPTQRSNFQMGDLEDLFTLGPAKDGETETGALFKGSERKVGEKKTKRQRPQGEEVEHVEGVTGAEELKQDDDTAATQEERLMEGIFSRSGVTSTLRHEQVVKGRLVKANASMLQREANEVANRARANLRQYEEQARSIPAGTVTWTGEFGTAGFPGSNNVRRGRAGPSSSSLLGGADGDNSGRGAQLAQHGPRPGGTMRKQDFVPLIVQFINRHNNKAPSKALVDHFNQYCPNKRQTNLFKGALEDVAVLAKDGRQSSSLRGYWRLREEDDEDE